MKHRITTILLTTFLGLIANAQKISNIIKLDDGRIVDNSHLFVDGDNCTFATDNGDAVDWAFYLKLLDNKGFSGPYLIVQNQPAFQLRLYEDVFSKIDHTAPIRNHCVYPEGFDDRAYFIGELIASIDNEEVDRVNITFDVLPRVPKIISAEIFGEYDFEYSSYGDGTWTDGTHIAMKVIAPGATSIAEWSTAPNATLFWQIPSPDYFYCINEFELTSSLDNIHLIKENHFDICNYIALVGHNRYGDSAGRSSWSQGWKGDTIAVNEYVTDPAVIADIEKLRLLETGVENVSDDFNDNETLYVKDNVLHYTGDYGEVLWIKIFDVSGRQILTQYYGAPFSLTSVPKGIYFAVYQTKKQIKKLKFILK